MTTPDPKPGDISALSTSTRVHRWQGLVYCFLPLEGMSVLQPYGVGISSSVWNCGQQAAELFRFRPHLFGSFALWSYLLIDAIVWIIGIVATLSFSRNLEAVPVSSPPSQPAGLGVVWAAINRESATVPPNDLGLRNIRQGKIRHQVSSFCVSLGSTR
jgi:hypothetical protein